MHTHPVKCDLRLGCVQGKKGVHTIELNGATVASSGADFTIKDPLGRTNELRAASVQECNSWVAAIEHNIDAAMQETTGSPRAAA